jgi:hypothetical protein
VTLIERLLKLLLLGNAHRRWGQPDLVVVELSVEDIPIYRLTAIV